MAAQLAAQLDAQMLDAFAAEEHPQRVETQSLRLLQAKTVLQAADLWTSEGWLAALDDFRSWLIREAA